MLMVAEYEAPRKGKGGEWSAGRVGTTACPLHASCHVRWVEGMGESRGPGVAGSCSAVYQLEKAGGGAGSLSLQPGP